MSSSIPPRTDEGRTLDLHAHTTASDGDQSPTQLVTLAVGAGLTALAVTDHDTTDGIAEAQAASAAWGIEIVPGIELSAIWERGECHILGYFVNPDSETLQDRLRDVRRERNQRNAQIVARFNAIGIPMTLEEVEAKAGGAVVARPHFAQVLIERGVIASVQEAFIRFLAEGQPAYVARERLSPAEAIHVIHDAGGVAVLAHPNLLRRDPDGTRAAIMALRGQGLDGIEARYSQHTAEDTARYLALAARLEMLTSGGSDFHGPTVKPDIAVGQVEDGRPAPHNLLDALRQRAADYA